MLRSVITVFWVLIGYVSMAQPIYFDEVFDGPSVTENMFNVLHHDDGYVFATVSQDLFEDTGAVALIFIDHDGVELARTEFAPETRNFNAGRFIEPTDSGYVYLNSITDTLDGSRDFCLIRYDDEGEVIFTKEYAKEGDDICFWGIECVDGGYALCGQSGNSDGSPADIMLIRTDSVGNELWRQFYGGASWEGGADVVEISDGGFLLLGWTRSFGLSERDFYLVRTDELGNEFWYETYGDSNFDSGVAIESLDDGNLLLAGYRNLSNKRQAYLYKVNQSGDVIWEQEYGDSQSTEEFRGVVELDNGDLVGVGLFDENSQTGSNNQGLLVRTDSEGNQKWLRTYDRNVQTDFFLSALPTDDGGFLLSGQSSNFDNFTQDAWLLKVDSVGCPYPNCTVGIDEEEKTVLVDVWPNPATDVLSIEKVGSSKQLDISVFDLSGKEILRFTQNDKQESIDVSGWPSGVYVLKGMDDEGRSFSMKVVKR